MKEGSALSPRTGYILYDIWIDSSAGNTVGFKKEPSYLEEINPSTCKKIYKKRQYMKFVSDSTKVINVEVILAAFTSSSDQCAHNLQFLRQRKK